MQIETRVTFGETSFAVRGPDDIYYRDERDELHGPFWSEFSDAKWEADILTAIRSLSRPGATLFDIGAWIGPIALCGAALGMKVVAIEPDPVALSRLLENIKSSALGGRIQVVNTAIWGEPLIELFSDSLGDSETSVWGKRVRGGQVKEIAASYLAVGMRLTDIVTRFGVGPNAIVKLDIEGAEFMVSEDLGHALKAERPSLILSLHPENVAAESGAGRDTPRARGLTTRLVEQLPDYRRFYWKTDRWHEGDKPAIVGVAATAAEHLKVLVGSDHQVVFNAASGH